MDKHPLEVAIDMLFERRKRLLDEYEGEIMSLSQSYNSDRHNIFAGPLFKLHNDIRFVAQIISLIRDHVPLSNGNAASQNEPVEGDDE